MLKNSGFQRNICIVTIFAFSAMIMPKNALAYNLAPISFSQMYSLAQNGDVEALRASVHRGMNIDTINANGDTGLCIAARNHDAYTYNSFRAAGANPRHPCTQYIADYENFVTSSYAVPVTATPRDAYGTLGKEDYSVSPRTWWILGGLALAGGITAIVLSHHHGGGGSKGGGSSSDSDNYQSLGKIAAQSAKVSSETSGSKQNTSIKEVVNNEIEKIVAIDLNNNVLENTKYLNVALKAQKGGTYTNTTAVPLKIGAGVVGMDAVDGSQVVNNGYINTDSFNASVAMVASENSTAVNNGKGIIDSSSEYGIDLNFSGYAENDTIIGMYADTNSTINNNGDIKATAIKAIEDPTKEEDDDSETKVTSSATGSIVGMEAMIINAGKNQNLNKIILNNNTNGRINLSAGDGGTDNDIKVSLTGMGSYLNYDFLNGSYNINLAESVELNNNGKIILNYTGKYSTASETDLAKGLGGIVGMRADANTTANNINSIDITLDDKDSGSSVDFAAAMQSLHGGNLNNSGQIKVTTNSANLRRNYGMLSVEGTGTVSGLYTNPNQKNMNKLVNTGNISMEVSNSYGMAAFNGGSIDNKGTINLGNPTTTLYRANIGMYGSKNNSETTMKNSGIIDVYSFNSFAMQNDYAGGTVMQNDGIVNIRRSAVNSFVFGGSYSEIHNANTINYYATATNQEDAATPGNDENPFANYQTSIGISAISTQAYYLDGNTAALVKDTSSTTQNIYNDENAKISMYGSSFVAAMAVETEQGSAINNGLIEIKNSEIENAINAIAMYLSSDTLNSAVITNNAQITTDSMFSAAMASDSQKNAGMVNNASIIADNEYSLGFYSSNKSYAYNKGTIEMHDNNSVGMFDTGKSTLRNFDEASILIGSENKAVKNGYGVYLLNNGQVSGITQFINDGTIDVYTTNLGAGIYSSTSGSSTGTNDITTQYNKSIENNKYINIYGDNAYGIYNSDNAAIVNSETGIINVGSPDKKVKNSYGIYNTGSGKVTNLGTINLYNEREGTAIYNSGTAQVENRGKIGLYNEKSTAIKTQNGDAINSATLDILNNNSKAMHLTGSSSIINDEDGVINVGSSEKAVHDSVALYADSVSSGSVINKGIINLYNDMNSRSDENKEESYALRVSGTATAQNENIINSYNDNSKAVLIEAKSNFTNNGIIDVKGENSYAVYALSDGDIINNRVISALGSGSVGIYGGKSAVITNSGNLTVGDGIGIEKGASVTNTSTGIITVEDGVGIKNAESITNEGKIYVNGNGNGIETADLDSSTIINSGEIYVSGKGNGIDVIVAKDTIPVLIQNSGIINVSDGWGIYVYKRYSLKYTYEVVSGKYTVEPDSTVIIPGSATKLVECTGWPCEVPEEISSLLSTSSTDSGLIMFEDNDLRKAIKLVNTGEIVTSGDIDFGTQTSEDAQISIGKKGTYKAKSFSGTVMADNSIIADGFDTTYVNEDSFVGADEGLNVLSSSYLFDASLQQNTKGNFDVVMTMSPFEDKINNSRIADYLSSNYAKQNGENIFTVLKSASDKKQFDEYLNKELGFNIIPNLIKQSLDIEKTVSNAVNDDLLTPTTEQSRHNANILAYKNEVKSKNEVSGYKDEVYAAYGFQDTALDKNKRLGFGLSVTRADSEFNDDSTRYNNIIEAYVPAIFNNNNFAALAKLKAGFARGHYRRVAVNDAYKAKTKEYFYGLDTAVRQNIDLRYFTLQPQAGFNVTGLYFDKLDESRDGLNTKDKNVVSALSAIGMTAAKQIVLDDNNDLNISANGTYYHEFGNNYTIKSSINGMEGYYDIDSNRLTRDYGLLALQLQYRHKNFRAGVSVNKPLEDEKKSYYILNLGYIF